MSSVFFIKGCLSNFYCFAERMQSPDFRKYHFKCRVIAALKSLAVLYVKILLECGVYTQSESMSIVSCKKSASTYNYKIFRCNNVRAVCTRLIVKICHNLDFSAEYAAQQFSVIADLTEICHR